MTKSSKYEGVIYNSSKERFIGRATIGGKRVDLCSDKDETTCALKRNAQLIARLGVEEAAPFLNEIDPDFSAPVTLKQQIDAHVEANPVTPEEVDAAVEGARVEEDLPFSVSEEQIDDAAAQAEDVNAFAFPESLPESLRVELELSGRYDLRDTAVVEDRPLLKLRSMTIANLNKLRAAEVEVGLRAPEVEQPVEDDAQVDDTIDEGVSTLIPVDQQEIVEVAEGDLIAPLSDAERADFARLKQEARQSFAILGRALKEISDRRLYREHFPSFEAFIAEEFDGKGRQWAYQLIGAATVVDQLSAVGVQPASERQARELKAAAKTVANLNPEQQAVVAKVVEGLTGTSRPLTAQVNAVVEVVAALDDAGAIEDPETGEAVLLSDLTPERRVALLTENVTNATYERLKRQESHIAEKGKQDATLNGKGSAGSSAANVSAASWSDWLMNYAAQGLSFDHDIRLTIKKDDSGNPVAVAQVVDRESGAIIAEGAPDTKRLKGAVMSLIEGLKYGGDVK